MPVQRREESDTSVSMLDGMRRGDNAAWNKFVAVFAPVLYERFRSKGYSEHDALDLGQDVFAKVRTSLHTFVRDGANLLFRKWLNTVVNSVTTDFHRKRQRQVRAGGGEAQAALEQVPDPIDDFGETENDKSMFVVRTFDLVKGDYSPQVSQGFWMVYVEGKSFTEAAQTLGTTSGALRTGANRLRNRIKQELEGLMD